MPPIPTSYRIGIALGILIIVVAGTFRVLTPRFNDVQKMVSARESRAQEIKKREEELRGLRDLASQFQTLPLETRERLSAALPPSPDIAAWLSSLSAIAERSGVSLDALEKGREVEDSGIVRVEYGVRLRGTYSSLRLFLTLLGQNLRLTDVRDMRVDNTSVLAADPLLAVNMTLAVYYQP